MKDLDGTRRYIRLGELPAFKKSNQDGYKISEDALNAFIWVKKASVSQVVNRILSNSDTQSEKAKHKVASFFAGIGGFDLGCERAGMEVVFQCEVNSFCQKVLKKHWPSVPLHGDINSLQAEDVPEANVWCGGFPCQDVSLANQGKRKGLKGERSGLFYKYAELVEERRPEWLVIENVPGLLNSHKGQDFRVLIGILEELGYGISWRVLDAKYFGTPQRRRRVYIVASLGDMRSARVLFNERSDQFVNSSGRGQRTQASPEVIRGLRKADVYAIQHASIGRKHTAGPQAKGYRNDGETYTLDSRGSADAVCEANDGFRMRATTRFSKELDSNRLRATGNAVAVPVITWIAQKIINVDEESEPTSLTSMEEMHQHGTACCPE
ncbi:DNA cytosine methyltransferase [Alteromonas sp. ALT199]|uniref:DNA cytosine methyltransferase n=1 Tax=unclassified Alteromonas TaxID=2614992 RepID=UPI001BE8F279|nr:DNA cytosine methyltransferase [Alteromonas sp. ALT199]MBT3135450.1 DNA cytosine methyltransferase [Alteromonas sp. ALT199]